MNSVNCSNNGTLTCGICQCNSGRYKLYNNNMTLLFTRFGANCQCDNTGLSGDGSNTTMCR